MDEGGVVITDVASAVFTPDPYDVPIERLNPGRASLFEQGVELSYFERLRREDPVHFTAESEFGPYWSITRYEDVVAVDTDHETFSAQPAITLADADDDFPLPSFIAMDPPRHTDHRKLVAPVGSPTNVARLETVVRAWTAQLLDELPEGEVVDWADKVALEVATFTLATLLGFPQEERRKLALWADAATLSGGVRSAAALTSRRAELEACMGRFAALRAERAGDVGGADLVSLLAQAEVTRDMDESQFLGAMVLLLVAGSDSTRSTLSGSVAALLRHPDEQSRLFADPTLVPALIPEVLRWQTPGAHMRRIARRTVDFGGKRIRRGDKVVMWYVSANRDEAVFERGDDFWIGRPNARRHLSFGSGVHRCLGARLAEMQLRVVWEETLKRFRRIEAAGQPVCYDSSFLRGYHTLPVRLTRAPN